MPSSSMLQGFVGRQLMGASFQTPQSFRANDVLISSVSGCAFGHEHASINTTSFNGVQAYPAASRVLAYMFTIGEPMLVYKVWWMNGGTVGTDSCDAGVYNEAGTTLILSGGSTLSANANVVQEKDSTDTLLQPGRYWCAFVQGGTTATPMMTPATAMTLRMAGCAQMAGSGSTLGSTFTPAAVAGSTFPYFGIAGRTQVA